MERERERERQKKQERERENENIRESRQTQGHNARVRGSVCVCMSKARVDENKMFLRPWRGKESFYVDSGETSLKGICQRNVPVSGE